MSDLFVGVFSCLFRDIWASREGSVLTGMLKLATENSQAQNLIGVLVHLDCFFLNDQK